MQGDRGVQGPQGYNASDGVTGRAGIPGPRVCVCVCGGGGGGVGVGVGV